MAYPHISSHENLGLTVDTKSAPRVGDVCIVNENIPKLDSGMLVNKNTKICVTDYVFNWNSRLGRSDIDKITAVTAFCCIWRQKTDAVTYFRLSLQ